MPHVRKLKQLSIEEEPKSQIVESGLTRTRAPGPAAAAKFLEELYPRKEEIAEKADAGQTRTSDDRQLLEIDGLNTALEEKYKEYISIDTSLSRALVSFQANKARAVYRWYKFKEAFSAELVEHLLNRFAVKRGVLLDPFAGSGTAVFASSGVGLDAEGIELLPIGQRIIQTKNMIDAGLSSDHLMRLSQWLTDEPWRMFGKSKPLSELRITKGAYPQETVEKIGNFLAAIEEEPDAVRDILFFALLCILEVISFTRKDGQYLRWDHRSNRRQGARIFDKGVIHPFDAAMGAKLTEIVSDLAALNSKTDLFSKPESRRGTIHLHHGSCLDILPMLGEHQYDGIITSPPYCNRYDYTRTYALELALLGVSEEKLIALRQEMLSCTVENRAKDLLRINKAWSLPIEAADKQEALQAILAYLQSQKDIGVLNNNGIPRMVRGYFYEMACVIFECARVLKPGAPLIMINDNVRYAGASIPVDLILTEVATSLGFAVESILVLPGGKGNSSQQMGAHGRDALRKCVYVWRKL